MKRYALLMLLGASAAGCASAQAKAAPDRPALEVPPPPPRVIETVTVTDPPVPDRVGDLPAAPATPRPRPTPPSRETAKPDPKPEPATEPAPPSPAPAAPPVPQLRTPGTSDTEASRQVREVIDRAKKSLSSVNYQRLTHELRAQYDSAKLMLTQSEDALKSTNFEFARNLADKADRIAKELQGR